MPSTALSVAAESGPAHYAVPDVGLFFAPPTAPVSTEGRGDDPGGAAATPDAEPALPSPLARVLAFFAIVVGGVSGALIGYAFVDLQCDEGCGFRAGLGAVAGAILAAIGVAVITVLALRAMSEWHEIQRSADDDLSVRPPD